MNSPDSDEGQLTEAERAQQEANFQYIVRLNRIFFLVMLVIAVVIVALWPTIPRYVGLIIVAAITGDVPP